MGSLIAIGFYVAVIGVAFYGFSFDVRRWLEDRRAHRLVMHTTFREDRFDSDLLDIWSLPETRGRRR